MRPHIDQRRWDYLRYVQHGVIGRFQLLELGATDSDIQRMLRRRELVVVHPGVYVDHNGPLTRVQREWAAVLALWPAALCHESAVPGVTTSTIHVGIALHRQLADLPGVAIHATAHLQERVDWRAAPPRVRAEHAVIDVMSKRIRNDDVAGAYAALTQACHSATRPERIERALARRARVSGRPMIVGMLTDLRTGACSVLERGYLNLVERPHGLPRGTRQLTTTATGRRTDKDVHYEDYGLVVELDGRAIHDHPAAWDDDARRDLAELATTDARTARVTYGLVFREHCVTGLRIARILQRGGWEGEFQRCVRCPAGLAA